MDAQRRLASRRCLQKPALLPSIRVQCITQRIIPPKNLIQKYRKGYASKYVRRLCVIYISCMKINVPLSYFVIDFWLYGQPSSTVEERSLILVKIRPDFCLEFDFVQNWSVSPSIQEHIFNKILTPRGWSKRSRLPRERTKAGEEAFWVHTNFKILQSEPPLEKLCVRHLHSENKDGKDVRDASKLQWLSKFEKLRNEKIHSNTRSDSFNTLIGTGREWFYFIACQLKQPSANWVFFY